MFERRVVLFFTASILVVGAIGGVVGYASTQPTRVERIVACVEKLGARTSVFHDPGGVDPVTDDSDSLPLFGPDPFDGPSTQLAVALPGGKSAVVKIPDEDGTVKVYDNGDPLSPRERAAIADCAGVPRT